MGVGEVGEGKEGNNGDGKKLDWSGEHTIQHIGDALCNSTLKPI